MVGLAPGYIGMFVFLTVPVSVTVHRVSSNRLWKAIMLWNSGPVEGNVNRIKTLKRQMYGGASFSLLRKRILLYT